MGLFLIAAEERVRNAYRAAVPQRRHPLSVTRETGHITWGSGIADASVVRTFHCTNLIISPDPVDPAAITTAVSHRIDRSPLAADRRRLPHWTRAEL